MTRYSHMWIGFLSSMAMYNPLQSSDRRLSLILMASCMFGAVAPDFDMHWTGFRQKTQEHAAYWSPKSNLFNSHRGWTHHIFVPFILVLISLFLSFPYKEILMAFTFGVIVHLVTDMFSPMGIPVFKNKDRARLPLYKTGQVSEILFVIILSVFMFLIFMPKFSFAYQPNFSNNTMLQQDYQKSLEIKKQEEAIRNKKKYFNEVQQRVLIYQHNKVNDKAKELANQSYKTFQGRQQEIQNDMLEFAKQNHIEIQNLMPNQGRQALASNSYIYIFMSSDVPFTVWRNYAMAINKLRHEGQGNIALVLRGCIGGCVKVMPTIKFVQRVLTYGNTKLLVPVVIDPMLFTMYGINRVPVFVYAKNVNLVNPGITAGVKQNLKNSVTAYKVVGDWGFNYALEKLYEESKDPALVKLYNMLNQSWFTK